MRSKKKNKRVPFVTSCIRTWLAQLNFRKTFRAFANESKKRNRFGLNWSDRHPCLSDKTTNTGFDRHYIYHPAWAARIVKETNPKVHIDISSCLAFCSMLSAFVPVKFYDYRPAKIVLPDLSSEKADLLHLDFMDESIMSISCMHTVEHIGLGRYGDPLDYDGDLKAMAELARVLAVGGNLLFVVPVGNKAIIQFNAHRIYERDQVVEQFSNLGLSLKEFTLIPENEIDGGLVIDPPVEVLNRQKYACGCFWFTKV